MTYIKSIKVKFLGFINFLYFLSFTLVYAEGVQPGSNALIPNPLGETSTLAGFVTLLLDTVFPIASIASVFFMIYAGFLMVTASGNEEKLGKAKTTFLWTVIGIAILLGAKVISAVICGTINQLGSPRLSC